MTLTFLGTRQNIFMACFQVVWVSGNNSSTDFKYLLLLKLCISFDRSQLHGNWRRLISTIVVAEWSRYAGFCKKCGCTSSTTNKLNTSILLHCLWQIPTPRRLKKTVAIWNISCCWSCMFSNLLVSSMYTWPQQPPIQLKCDRLIPDQWHLKKTSAHWMVICTFLNPTVLTKNVWSQQPPTNIMLSVTV